MCNVLDQESAGRRPVVLCRWRQIVTLAGLLFLVGRLGFAQGNPPQFRTAKLTRGDVVETVAAFGTLEPEDTIDVAATVAGQIVSLGIDPHGDGKPIDFGSQVEVGMVLARIDDTSSRLRVEQEEAGWRRAKAEFEGPAPRPAGSTEINLAAKRAAEGAIAQSEARLKLARLESRPPPSLSRPSRA